MSIRPFLAVVALWVLLGTLFWLALNAPMVMLFAVLAGLALALSVGVYLFAAAFEDRR